MEKSQDWQEHREGILENLSSVGHLEATFAERIAVLSWRLHRVIRYETQTIALSQVQIEEAIQERRRFVLALRNGSINTRPEDIRLQAKHDKKAHSALRRFPSHGDDKTLSPEDATSVVWGVLMAAQKGVEEERMYAPCTYPYLTSPALTLGGRTSPAPLRNENGRSVRERVLSKELYFPEVRRLRSEGDR
jgi:hypothetical protein